MRYLTRHWNEYRLSDNAYSWWTGESYPTREAVDKWLDGNGYEFSCRLNYSIEVWEKR